MKNELTGFPLQVVEKMVDRQEEQHNEANINIFKSCVLACHITGGFTWEHTKEGFNFWYDVIVTKDFNLFFEKYPRTNPLTIKK